jgi:hypothetical protein
MENAGLRTVLQQALSELNYALNFNMIVISVCYCRSQVETALNFATFLKFKRLSMESVVEVRQFLVNKNVKMC